MQRHPTRMAGREFVRLSPTGNKSFYLSLVDGTFNFLEKKRTSGMMSPCFNDMNYLILPMLLGLYKPICLPLVQFKFASRLNIKMFLLSHIMKTLPLANS